MRNERVEGRGLAEALADAAKQLDAATSVTLFGSHARDEADTRSDLDVLVVWKTPGEDREEAEENRERQLEAFETQAQETTGWHPETLTLEEDEARRLLEETTGALPLAALEGVHLHGERLRDLTEAEVRLDAEADRLEQQHRSLRRAEGWERGRAALEAEKTSPILPHLLWETGYWAAKSVLAGLAQPRLQERRIEDALTNLAREERRAPGAAAALEILHRLHTQYDAGEGATSEDVEAGRGAAAHLLATARTLAEESR